MSHDQSRYNPDVNTFIIDDDETGNAGNSDSNTSVEDIPVPPDTDPSAPIEEPPRPDGGPTGDLDDSPKQIV